MYSPSMISLRLLIYLLYLSSIKDTGPVKGASSLALALPEDGSFYISISVFLQPPYQDFAD